MIDQATTNDPQTYDLLNTHPTVSDARLDTSVQGIAFRQGDWSRQVLPGDPSCELCGLVELIDNNPLVCADRFSTPDPVSTLVLLAIGPLIEAGILLEAPVVLCNFEPLNLAGFVSRAGWQKGVTVEQMDPGLGDVISVNVMAEITTLDDWNDLDALYEERYGRSFYVRRMENEDWDVRLVAGQPYAAYRLRIGPDEPHSLLTIQTLADRNGKCGASQMVHAMNVMAGFEESLGVG